MEWSRWTTPGEIVSQKIRINNSRGNLKSWSHTPGGWSKTDRVFHYVFLSIRRPIPVGSKTPPESRSPGIRRRRISTDGRGSTLELHLAGRGWAGRDHAGWLLDGSAAPIGPPSRRKEPDRLLEVGDQEGHLLGRKPPGIAWDRLDGPDPQIVRDEGEGSDRQGDDIRERREG